MPGFGPARHASARHVARGTCLLCSKICTSVHMCDGNLLESSIAILQAFIFDFFFATKMDAGTAPRFSQVPKQTLQRIIFCYEIKFPNTSQNCSARRGTRARRLVGHQISNTCQELFGTARHGTARGTRAGRHVRTLDYSSI